MKAEPRPLRSARVLIAGWFLAGFIPLQANAVPVQLRWDYSASGAAGFVLYCGPASRTYRTRIDIGNTETYTIGSLPEGTTSFCAVTAYDPGKAESTYSNELRVYVPKGTSSGVIVVPAPIPAPVPAPVPPRL
jgi:hypothetical protein